MLATHSGRYASTPVGCTKRYRPCVTVPFRLLREALRHLSLEPDEQRAALDGCPVTDELALDLDNAVTSLAHASEEAGLTLDREVVAALAALHEGLSAPPDAPVWDDEALDQHPVWADARATSRSLLARLPQAGRCR